MSFGKEMRISELSERAGVSLRTLRFYEQIGLINPRREGKNRLYSPRDQIKLELIQKGKRFGFTLGEIARLLGNVSQSTSFEETLTQAQIDAQIEQLSQRRESIEAAIVALRSSLAELDRAEAGRPEASAPEQLPNRNGGTDTEHSTKMAVGSV